MELHGRDTASIRFGQVPLAPADQELKQALNGSLLALCGELPEPLQGSAAIFLSTAGGTPPGRFDFIRVFYAPLWTFINHLAPPGDAGQEHRRARAIRGQAMAMLLHLLDDHLVDGDEPADHMLLQLRTFAWNAFDDSVRELAEREDRGSAMVRELIDGYFSAVHAPPRGDSLEIYLRTFRAQIGTWLAVPMLLAGSKAAGVRTCLEEFSLAWRILDDVQDLDKDSERAAPTAVYFALSTESRRIWKDPAMLGNRRELLREALERENVLEGLLGRAREHLKIAAASARDSGWSAYAEQITALGGEL